MYVIFLCIYHILCGGGACVCECARTYAQIQLLVTTWTVTHQAPLSVGFPQQEYWSRLLFPSPGDLPDPGVELSSLALAGSLLTSEPPGKPLINDKKTQIPKHFNSLSGSTHLHSCW